MAGSAASAAISVRCVSLLIMVLLTTFKKGTGHGFLGLHIGVTCSCMSNGSQSSAGKTEGTTF
jgi:hypothetical protein